MRHAHSVHKMGVDSFLTMPCEKFCIFWITQNLKLGVNCGRGIRLGCEYHIARGDVVCRTTPIYPTKHTHSNKKLYLHYNFLPIQQLLFITST